MALKDSSNRSPWHEPVRKQISQTPATHCTRKSPLPLLPSGPGGVGGSASRGTDA